MKYRLLDRAEQDLEAIADDLADKNPRAALALVERFHSRWDLLGDFPFSGPARPDLSPDARHVVVDDYLTLYRVRNGTVEIVRVLHGRRDIKPGDFGA
jgi:toxin ParE1/3/4